MTTLLFACCSSDNETQAETTQTLDMTTMNITVDGQTLSVVLEDNAATRELVVALKQAPITYEASDYGGFEKVGPLGRSLPTSNQDITTQAGDVVLYSGNQIVLFYGSNSWSYTRLGRIEHTSLDALKSFLKAGEGTIRVTLSLPAATALNTPHRAAEQSKYYSLNGQRVDRSSKSSAFKPTKHGIIVL